MNPEPNLGSPKVGEDNFEKLKQLVSDLEKYRVDIEKALWYGQNSHTFDDFVGKVLRNEVHFYPLGSAFVAMEIIQQPQYNVYHTFLAGGDMQPILDCHPWMLENAKQLGCKYVSICGRHGWERVLKDYGWKKQYTVLRKEVT